MRNTLTALTLVLLPLVSMAEQVVTTDRPLSKTSTLVSEKCEGQTPTSIVGRWQHDFVRTENEQQALEAGRDLAPEEAFVATANSVEMLITSNSYVTSVPGLFEYKVSYRVVGGSSGRFVLEPFDDQGVGDTFEVLLVPCGLKMLATSTHCTTEFCERSRDEIFKQIAEKMGVSAEELKRQSAETPVPQRIPQYYRSVTEPPAN